MSSPELILMGTRLRSTIEQQLKKETKDFPLHSDVATSLPQDSLPSIAPDIYKQSHDHQIALLQSENAELLTKCETYIKGNHKKDKLLAEMTRNCNERSTAQAELERKNKQLHTDQVAVQQYIERLKMNQTSVSTVVTKLQSDFKHYQQDLTRLSELHQTTSRALQVSSEDNDRMHELLRQKEDAMQDLRNSLNEAEAQSTTLKLQLDSQQTQSKHHDALRRRTHTELEQYRDIVHVENRISSCISSAVEQTTNWKDDINSLTIEAKALFESLAASRSTALERRDHELQLLHDQLLAHTNSSLIINANSHNDNKSGGSGGSGSVYTPATVDADVKAVVAGTVAEPTTAIDAYSDMPLATGRRSSVTSAAHTEAHTATASIRTTTSAAVLNMVNEKLPAVTDDNCGSGPKRKWDEHELSSSLSHANGKPRQSARSSSSQQSLSPVDSNASVAAAAAAAVAAAAIPATNAAADGKPLPTTTAVPHKTTDDNKKRNLKHPGGGGGGGGCPVCGEAAYGLMKMCQRGCRREFHSSCARRIMAAASASGKAGASAGGVGCWGQPQQQLFVCNDCTVAGSIKSISVDVDC